MSISDIASSSALKIQSLLDMRQQIDDLQRQLGTGKKADTYAGLGVSTGLAVTLRSQLSAMSSFGDTITSVGIRLNTAQTALQQIDQSVHTVKSATQLTRYVIDQTGQTTDQRTSAGQLDQILAALNTQVGDNYIFSGASPDQPAVESLDHILNGNGARAGFKQIISERNQADLGASGLGRLVIPAAAGSVVSMSEDVAGSPFGFKLGAVNSALTGAIVTGPAGSPATISVNLGATNPNNGDTVKFTFNLPDGSTENLTLTATSSTTPGANQFTIGATPAATAANLQATLTASVGQLAQTSLSAASAIAAANDFFNVSAASPPRRVGGPPFTTATTLVSGTSANTVTWYTGEAGATSARSTATARIDKTISVSYGTRANEQGIRWAVQNIAVFAAMTFSSADPNASNRYSALTQRLGPNLDVPQGTQRIPDIEAELAGAQTSMKAVQDRLTQAKATAQNMSDSIEGISNEEVASKILALQTRLQASYQATTTLYHTSLVNYLSP